MGAFSQALLRQPKEEFLHLRALIDAHTPIRYSTDAPQLIKAWRRIDSELGIDVEPANQCCE
jgi:hypothetical protein